MIEICTALLSLMFVKKLKKKKKTKEEGRKKREEGRLINIRYAFRNKFVNLYY